MKMIKNVFFIFVLFVIINLIAFFAGSETAFLSINKIELRKMIGEGRKNAKTAAKLRENIDELLTIILIGINFMNTLGSAIATALAVSLAGNSGIGIATVCFTFFSVIFGEIIPKTVAGRYPEESVCKNSVPLLVLEKVFFPVVWIFSAISKGTASLAKNVLRDDTPLVTEEELKTLIDVGAQEGTLEASEKTMLDKIFRFNDLSVHDIMKHRSLVKSVSVEDSREKVVQMFVSTGLSMLPVYEGSKESIVGVIHYKAVLFSPEKNVQKNYAAAVMKNVLFVPETFTALELLAKFKKEHTEFAVALNEQGFLAGVATIDDIQRVIFGRMADDDKSKIPAEERIKLVSSNEFIVPGDLKLEDLNSILKLNLESDEYMTLGGWLLEKIGYLPSNGELFAWKNCLFFIEDQSQRRIQQVRIKFVKSGQGVKK